MAHTAPQATQPVIDPVFIQQAETLVSGGELLPGGVQALAEKLQESAQTSRPLRVKLGLDPTRPDLHLGHTVVLRKLRAFQDLGHQAVLIIGDATAMIGDPSGRNQTRPPLTDEEVQVNAQTYLDQASKVIDVKKAEIVRNSEWFRGMGLSHFLQLSAKVTVAQMLVRDDFAKRYQGNTPIFLHELFYPLMQGYDSVMVKADIELGGTDQRFNNLMGRELQTAYQVPYQQLVLLMPLLEGTDGKIKMSKSYPEHCINLTDSPEDMFGKMMSIPDPLLERYEQLLTPITPAQLAEQLALMEQGKLNPRDVKAHLAKWVIGLYYSAEAAAQAEEHFVTLFKKKALPEDLAEFQLQANTAYHLPTLMVEQQLAPSKGEARRLIQGGGVKLHDETGTTHEKITDPDHQLQVEPGQVHVLQVGKRQFLKLKF